MDILQQIIDMDKAAAARAEAAVEEKRRLSDESGEEAAKAAKELISAERVKAQSYCQKQEQKLSQKLFRAEKNRDEQCGKLDDSFNAHKSEWKAEIMRRITGG